MSRRRRRREFPWSTAIGILFVVNIISGLYASRLTSLIKIRVEGALRDDKPRIKAILERVHSKPALQLDRRRTEGQILEKSEVETAEMSRNIFGRARVVIKYRKPVARLRGLSGMAMSRDGVVFQTGRDLSGLPALQLPESSLSPAITLTGHWRFREAAGLASDIADLAEVESVQIEPTEDGGLCLNIGSKFAVDLGLPEQLDAKVAYLRKQIEDDPALLASGKTLNLVSLERPSYRDGVIKKRK